MSGVVLAVSTSPEHGPPKHNRDSVHLLEGRGVEGDADGNLLRKAGVMGVVLVGGEVRPGDSIEVELPDGPHAALEPV